MEICLLIAVVDHFFILNYSDFAMNAYHRIIQSRGSCNDVDLM